ncbi:MAG: histone deacetylase [Phycisphaera sp.]|nr:histone deacetylase [Phycisphaera sp.]
MRTGLVYDDRFLDHDTGPQHPERSDRLRAIVERLKRDHHWDRCLRLPVEPALVTSIQAVHDATYIEHVRATCEQGGAYVDVQDSAVCPVSFEVARLAVGGVIGAVDAVMAGLCDNAFCAVRPPGHHAERDRSMGFCLFNNVAVAAQHLISQHRLGKVAIVDFDVHHGNGTQHIFEARPDVLFISLHEHPSYLYPGTGFSWEAGQDRGEGFTINIPFDPHAGDEAYRHAFKHKVIPALDAFGPDFVLISAGFDAACDDPLAHMQLSTLGFAWMTRQLKELAERVCSGRLVSVLEGGYDLRSLAECVSAHVAVLLEEDGHDGLMGMKAGM